MKNINLKRIAIICGAAVLLSACTKDIVTGRVVCEGKGIADVVVSDGHICCLTDASGRYRFHSDMPEGYVFISIPSGYEVSAQGLIPQFFTREKKAIFELKKIDQSKFKMLVFTDIHLTGDKVDDDLRQFHSIFFPDFVRSARDLLDEGPAYSICLGDMTTDGKWYKNNYALPEYLKELDGFPLPIFHVMGNHDNDQKCEGSVEEWASLAEQRFKNEVGPNYYSMNIGGVHFVMLDDIITHGPLGEGNPALDPVGKFGFTYAFDQRQLDWIKKDLSYVPEDTPLVLCFHVPPFKDGKKKVHNAEALTSMLEKYEKVDLLCGHYHTTRIDSIAPNILQHIIASASTVSWKLNDVPGAPLVCDDGTPAGYQLFTFEGGTASWQYKSVYHPVEESQCSVYDLGRGDFLINIFNWDPHWDVVARCGDKILDIKQIWEDDPSYVRLRKETKMLLKRPKAFLPHKSPHFFKGHFDGKPDEFRVDMTDRFGNKYTARFGQKAF